MTTARRGSLVVVGTGISLVGQTTLEAVAHIERAEVVLYAVNDAATETWLRRLNPRAVTLADLYAEGKPRGRTYREMAARILSHVRNGRRVCAAFYGHPGVVVDASHAAIRLARREGFSARMLPGISTTDCLLADLGVNPGHVGCQTYEATNFLMWRRRFDATSALILWQVGVLGEPSVRKGMSCRPERLRVLTAVLRRHYPARHPVVLYEAAPLPICPPRIQRIALADLPRQSVLPITTMYVPPRQPTRPDPRVTRWLAEEPRSPHT